METDRKVNRESLQIHDSNLPLSNPEIQQEKDLMDHIPVFLIQLSAVLSIILAIVTICFVEMKL